MDDDSIIIRPSDKGSQVVVLDAIKYCELVENNISNSEIYTEIDDPNILNKT